jgi:hypothetical protein
MAAEQILTIYREIKLKAFSTRIARLEALRYLGPSMDFLETGESKAIFSLALEETNLKTRVVLLISLLMLNVIVATFFRFLWFYIVIFGSSTSPFLTYVVPGILYYHQQKASNQRARLAFAFGVFGLIQIVLLSASSIFMWHIDLYMNINTLW